MEKPLIAVVTEPEFRRAEAVFGSDPRIHCIPAPEAEENLASFIRDTGARYAIVGASTYRDGLYSALPSGGVIARFGVGHDGIDKVKATRAGLLCTNTPDVLVDSVAEFTMMLILAAARHVATFTEEIKGGVWRLQPGVEVRGKTIAIIGCGEIGSRVAQIASDGFQMKVICAGRSDDYRSAVSGADFVSLHISATPDNSHFMNQDRLGMIRKEAWLINTARGYMVDERALYDALAARRIAGAALDVFEREPYEPIDPARDLRPLPNVILTPHAASSTREASARMAERALQNVRLAQTGDFAAMDLLNPEVLLK